MFLLIPTAGIRNVDGLAYLHSNMFLLIPVTHKRTNKDVEIFTFQYVSINTAGDYPVETLEKTFTFQYVSINTIGRVERGFRFNEFTFQYVSINTCLFLAMLSTILHLHSNMFLLIRKHPNQPNGHYIIYIPICFY